MSSAPSYRITEILLWVTTILPCIIFILSMVMKGYASFWMSPAVFALNFPVGVLLTVLTLKYRKSQEKAKQATTALPPLPALCHAAAITFYSFIAAAWLGSFSFETVIVSIGVSPDSGLELWERRHLIGAAYAEVALSLLQAILLIWLAAAAGKTRMAIRAHYFAQNPPSTPLAIAPLTPQVRLTQRLVWALLALSIAVLAVSMVNIAWASLFVGACGSGLTMIYALTLFILGFKENKERRRAASRVEPADEESSVAKGELKGVKGDSAHTYPPTNTESAPSTPKNVRTPYNTLPCTSRAPSIICGFLLLIPWGTALGLLVATAVFYQSAEDTWGLQVANDDGWFHISAAAVELALTVLTFPLFAWFVVRSLLQRRRLLSAYKP